MAPPADALSHSVPHRGYDLPEGNATIIWRLALVPVCSKAFSLKPAHGALGEVTILKTTARENNMLLANALGHFNNCFSQ